MSDLLTPSEAADMLGVSPKTMIRWARLGAVPVARTLPSGRLRFERSVIEAIAAPDSEPVAS